MFKTLELPSCYRLCLVRILFTNKMLNVRDVTTTSLEESIYVVPFRVKYIQNNVSKTWDLIKTHHSVTVIIYNKTRNALVCVKQFRPGVYFNSIPVDERIGKINTDKYPPDYGITLEFCSGIVDKDKSLDEIAAEEVFEECGYSISPSLLEKVKSYRSAVGVAGDIATLFYAEVTDDMKTGSGGGIEDELIEVVYLTMEDVKRLLFDDAVGQRANMSGEFLYGLMWFSDRHNKN